jgi:fatty-acyl-CoA synthase
VLHLQRAPVIQSWRFAEYMQLGPEDVVFTAQPFFWTAGMTMSLGATLAAGACLVLQETFEPGAALALIEKERATTVHAWPHQEKALAEHPDATRRDLSSVCKIEARSPLAPLAGIVKDEWGTYGAYGLSETFTLATALPASAPAELRRTTSGPPLPGMSIRIVDPESGALLPAGEKGEVAVKGVTLMRGYYKVDPSFCFDSDGYFHTQDGGWLDEDGYLHWTGRLSNLIKTGGANVSPLEVERALAPSDEIRVGLAVGVPHPVLGEAIVLCAVRAEGAAIDEARREAEIRRQLREKLAAYKVPKRVLFFDAGELAYTGNQKIQVGPLREAALARLQQEGAEIDGVSYRRPA